VSQAEHNPANYCYRHPDRQSFVLCQRCGRTICPECQTQAAVGVHCPECTREARQSAPRTKPAIVTAMRSAGRRGAPVVTYSLIAVCVLVYIAQMVTGGTGGLVTNLFVYYGPYTATQPWRMVTSIFIHASILHILFNMYSLFIFGPIMEQMLGRARFLVLFFLAGIGGSVAVLLIAPTVPVLGASGAIFGLFTGFFVIQRRLGGNSTQLLVLIVINLVIGFIPGLGIAWQAHVGGLVVGAAVAWIYTRTRNRTQRVEQFLMVGGVAVVLIALTVVGTALLPGRLS
jgi:membrane associated rhomboid family serine protease